MPTISASRDALYTLLGRSYTDSEFEEICFDFGIELDEIVETASENSTSPAEVTFKLDVAANRYDLFSTEGVASALRCFTQIDSQPPDYAVVLPQAQPQVQFHVEKAPSLRPHLICAVLRNIRLDEAVYTSFIEAQEKLCQTAGRCRSLVAVGTHDLDTVGTTFTYTEEAPDRIHFRALGQSREMSAKQLAEMYAGGVSHLRQYVPLLAQAERWPVIRDLESGEIISLPPLVNCERTRIVAGRTRNILLECTGTDLTRMEAVLDALVTAFSVYCERRHTCEGAQVLAAGGQLGATWPRLHSRNMTLSCDYVHAMLGVSVRASEVAALLLRMGLRSVLVSHEAHERVFGAQLEVTVPPTRHDVLHACDLVEDVAIALAYRNIETQLPDKVCCVARQTALGALTTQLRHTLAEAGFTETLTFALCSHADSAHNFRPDVEGGVSDKSRAVTIANPKTVDFQALRTSLVPGLLKTLAANRHLGVPLRLFEVSDVVFSSRRHETGAVNVRHLAAVFCSTSDGFQVIHGLLDRLMLALGVAGDCYWLHSAGTSDCFLQGRSAAVCVNGGTCVGQLGVLHPDILRHYELTMPCSVLEMSIEEFV